MPNKKINELSPRTPSLTDLIIVGDPSTGYSYKATISVLTAFAGSNIQFSSLGGISLTSPANGQVLQFNGTSWVNYTPTTWNTAYDRSLVSAAVSGSTTKTLTLTKQDGSTLTATWSDLNTDAVTSVFGRTGAVVATEGDYSLDLLSDVTLSTPTTNQVLQYNGTAWVNATFVAGINSLNGLTATTQTFATGTSGTDFGISSTTSTHTFNLPTASGTNRGALSSADWTTFNSKVGGSGTTNYLSKWTSSSALGNSLVFDNGTNVGIGVTTPQAGLNIFTYGTKWITDNSTYWQPAGDIYLSMYSNTNNAKWFGISGSYGGSSSANLLLQSTFNAAGQQAGNYIGSEPISSNQYLTFGKLTASASLTGNAVKSEFARFGTTGNLLIGTTTDAGYRLDVSGTFRATGAALIGASAYSDGLGIVIGKIGTGAASRGTLAADNNYQDFQFVKTDIAAGNINSWAFGQRYDTYFGNTSGSFQIVGAYVNNSGTASAVGGGFRVPLICNPNGDVIIAGASANAVNGNVGIGTTSPAYKLDVNGAGNFSGGVNVTGSGTLVNEFRSNGIIAIDMTPNLTDDYKFRTLVAVSGDVTQTAINNISINSGGFFGFGGGGSEKMRLTSAGRLLIGTTTESTFLLDVNGTARIQTSLAINRTSAARTIDVNGNGYVRGDFGIFGNFEATRSDGSNLATLFSSTNNTTSNTLTIQSGNGTLSGKNNFITVSNIDATAQSWSFGLIGNNNFTLRNTTSSTTAISVDASNNVGIGTTSPSYKLDVNGTARVSGITTISRNDGATGTNAGSLYVLNTSTTGANYILVGQDNSVNSSGFGWHPSGASTYNSLVAKTAYWYALSGAAQLSFNTTTNTQPITFCTADWIERMRVAGNGNILIGTTTDAGYKLDVNGTARVQSDAVINTLNLGRGNGNVSTNTVFGFETLNSSATGGNNVAIGYQASKVLSSGVANVAIGTQALFNVTSGSYNVAIGNVPGNKITTGSSNVLLGYFAGGSLISASENVHIGHNAGGSSTAGGNVYIGFQSMTSNSTGTGNVTLGNRAGLASTTGSSNTLIGHYVGVTMTTASENVLLGQYAGYSLNSNQNTGIGSQSLYSITSGANNVALGYIAGRYVTAGTANQTSSNSTYLGYDTRASADGNTNEIVIGYQARGNGSNTVTLGNTSIVTTVLQGSVGIGTSSPNASALLDVSSTTKGFLPPRMTNAQMVAIATPAAGLVVYDTTNNKLNIYDGTNWVAVH